MSVELPERIWLVCDLYTKEAVEAFEILQNAGFFITVSHYKDSVEFAEPHVYAGEAGHYDELMAIKWFANTFGQIAMEANYPGFVKRT